MLSQPVLRTILLVEDEALLAANTARLLQNHGYCVVTALHSDQAILLLTRTPSIDLVLIDIDLGQNQPDGTQVARQILSQRQIPIVFLSGHTEPEVLARTESITSYGYVVKGSGENVLLATLNMAFQLYETNCQLNERDERLQKALVEQRVVAEALQQKSDELEMFFENAHSLLCFADLNGYFRRVNREWENVLGYTSEELSGCRYLDLVHPDDLAATMETMSVLSDQKAVDCFVNRYRCRDGSYRWIEWRSKPFGEMVLGTANDITDRKRLEFTQTFLAGCSSQGERFFQELARYLGEHLNIDYVCIDQLEQEGLIARTVAVFSDGRFEENYQYSLADTPCGVLATQKVCCYPRDVRSLFPRDQMLQEFGAEGYAGVTLFNSKGRPFGLIALITRAPMAYPRQVETVLQLVGVRAGAEMERAQAEEALRASEERYRALIEISPDPISLTDLAGNFTMINIAGLHELGYESLEELRAEGVTSLNLIIEEDQPRAFENMRKTFEQGSVRNIEYRVRMRDGTVKWTEISAAAISDSEGRPTAFIAITHDISERKRALESKSTLLRDLQHRIKNSLALITSLILLEQNNAQLPETRKSLNEIFDRVSSLAKLYNILYESQDIQQVNLAQYLSLVAQSLSSSYRHSGVDIETSFTSVLIDVRAATPFGLIMNELLTNALKYAFPDGRSGKIWASLAHIGDYLVLEVRDNGVGLPEDQAQPGSGLGLQLVRLLVRQLKASFDLQSGEETRFTVKVLYRNVC